MKKFFLTMVASLVCLTSAWAGSKYSVEVNLNTNEVTVLEDGVAVQGKTNSGESLATVQVTLDAQQNIRCTLQSFKGIELSDVPPCELQKDGTIRFYGLSFKSDAVKRAFGEAMNYLRKTDEPISVYLFDN